ncbi:hypothetical protein ABVC40_00415, partial [Lactobacillus iners]
WRNIKLFALIGLALVLWGHSHPIVNIIGQIFTMAALSLMAIQEIRNRSIFILTITFALLQLVTIIGTTVSLVHS